MSRSNNFYFFFLSNLFAFGFWNSFMLGQKAFKTWVGIVEGLTRTIRQCLFWLMLHILEITVVWIVPNVSLTFGTIWIKSNHDHESFLMTEHLNSNRYWWLGV